MHSDLTPKIHQPADSCGRHLPLSGAITQLRNDARDSEKLFKIIVYGSSSFHLNMKQGTNLLSHRFDLSLLGLSGFFNVFR